MASSEEPCLLIDSFPSSPVQSKEEMPEICVTHKRINVYNRLSREELVKALTKRLLERCHCSNYSCSAPKKPGGPTSPVLHRGIFSETVLKYLIENGMSENSIMRAMKFGLRNLNDTDLQHFGKYGIKSNILESESTWSRGIHDELTERLNSTGMNNSESLKILILGIISHDSSYMYRMVIGGIDVPGILNWKGPMISVSPEMIEFMKSLGIEDTIETITSIDEEVMEMLKDLGYSEFIEMQQIVICKCEFPRKKIQEKTSKEINDSESLVSYWTMDVLNKKNYLRKKLMIPLTWALSETLKFRPTNPKHFVACQLNRWKYNSCPTSELKDILKFVSTATKLTDDKLVAEYEIEELRQLKKRNQNLPCGICLENSGLEFCTKCEKKMVKSLCEFPDDCSTCKQKFSDFSINDLE